MNQTAVSAPGASLLPDWTDLFTATHLVFIAVLAVLVIAGIIFGARLSRRRRQARAELESHNAQVEQHTPPPAPIPDPSPPPRAPEVRETAASPFPSPSPAVTPLRPTPPAPEPLRPTPPLHPSPIPPVPVQPTAPSAADGPVTQLKGLGPKVATRLGELGVTTVGQMAALTDDEAQALDAQLGPFMGRMGRDRWQEQARFLAAGDVKGFEAVFGRL